MKTLCYDTETTTHSKGNPFSRRNWMVSIGWLQDGGSYDSTYFTHPHSHELGLGRFNQALVEAEVLIGFNLKFDLHWIRRYGCQFQNKQVWDCQLAHFMLTHQQAVLPSLQQVGEYYGLGGKVDGFAEKYWDKGVDTNQIPVDELMEYMEQDVRLTYKVYEAQREHFKSNIDLYKLFQIHCMDLLVLEEMEWNGLKLNLELCAEKSKTINARIKDIKARLNNLYPNVPVNWASGDHLSAILYGGKIVEEYKEQVGVYKTGEKTGLPRYRNHDRVHEFDGFFKPLERTELKKQGYWSTDESVLRRLKGNKVGKAIVEDVLELSKLDKLLDYYEGWPELCKTKDWPDGEIHGQFNQVIAKTGRLSSSDPNQQNLAGECQDIIVSRYE
jgi:DNA polymerase I-like protein with 3'-5' exonuclease and polymerase domains